MNKLEKSIRLHIKKLIISAMFLALCMILPLLTAQIQSIGQALLPMHLPVLLCGIICGPVWGASVGFIAPLLRYVLFGMPPIYPMGIAMAFELAVYGAVIGILYLCLSEKRGGSIISLLGAMISGRVVWGAVRLILSGIEGTSFGFAAFISGAVTMAVPGIICQIILVPIITLVLKKSKLIPIK